MKRVKLWPGMVFGLIGLNFCIVAATVYSARAHHASFSVESDYDRKALHWEDSARQLQRNAALGWSLRIDAAESGQLGVSLLDRDGNKIDGAAIAVEAFHHARAGNRITASLSPTASGYAAVIDATKPGLWQFNFIVHHGPDTFTSAVTRAIGGASS